MSIKELSRNQEHDLAVQTMYSFLMLEKTNQVIDFKEIIKLVFEREYEETSVYIRELLLSSLKYQRIIIEEISKYLKNRVFERLNVCMQAILILSYAEYYYMKDSDKAIVINIAVKLAKKYGDGQDYKYINAVLDNALDEK